MIKLIKNDLLVYAEEVNTELLSDNYDIEIFYVDDSSEMVRLERKYFRNKIDQIEDGFMKFKNPVTNLAAAASLDSVEYYLDVLTDKLVDATIACTCARNFNKESYYAEYGS